MHWPKVKMSHLLHIHVKLLNIRMIFPRILSFDNWHHTLVSFLRGTMVEGEPDTFLLCTYIKGSTMNLLHFDLWLP